MDRTCTLFTTSGPIRPGELATDVAPIPTAMLEASGRRKQRFYETLHRRERPAESGTIQFGFWSGFRGRSLRPGDHVYPFELLLDPLLPESMFLEGNEVSYHLVAYVRRPGVGRRGLSHQLPVTVIRCPTESTLEQLEPIHITRTWRHQLRCDIHVSAKAAPLGHRLPISVCLTQLSKSIHVKLAVYLTEIVQHGDKYGQWSTKAPCRKILLFSGERGPCRDHRLGHKTFCSATSVGMNDYQHVSTDESAILNHAGCSDPLGDAVGNSSLELGLEMQLPFCSTHAQRRDLPEAHCDISSDSVRVSHNLEVSSTAS